MKPWQRKDRSLKADEGKMSKQSLTEPSRHSVSGSVAVSRVSVDSSSKKSPLSLNHSLPGDTLVN